jgi:hypothetical protein
MFKKNQKYLYIFISLFVIVIVAQYLLPKPINWARTYNSKSREPFGCYAIYNLLQGTFAKNIETNRQTFYNIRNDESGKSSVLMVDDQIALNRNDVKSLLNYVKRGNKVFIASGVFGGHLADTFHITVGADFVGFFMPDDSVKEKGGQEVHLCAKNLSKKKYSYSQMAWGRLFENFDSTRFSILATNAKGFACLIKTRTGKGELYFCSSPEIFSNYFVVNHPNRELAYHMLSLISNENLVWDEYYKAHNEKNRSPLKLILENDSLYAAWLLLLLTVIFYMVFEGRRRQRPVPVAVPVTNSTLEFVNVISHVYFNEGNHQSIGAEKVKYFYENIRRKFHVSTQVIDEPLINEIAELSGADPKKVKQLFTYCEKIKASNGITQLELAELNRQINNFNKYSLR